MDKYFYSFLKSIKILRQSIYLKKMTIFHKSLFSYDNSGMISCPETVQKDSEFLCTMFSVIMPLPQSITTISLCW